MTAAEPARGPFADAAETLAGLVNTAPDSAAVQALLETALQQAYDDGYDERDEEGCQARHFTEQQTAYDADKQAVLDALESLHDQHDPKFPARLCRDCSSLVAIADLIPTWS